MEVAGVKMQGVSFWRANERGILENIAKYRHPFKKGEGEKIHANMVTFLHINQDFC